MWFGATDPVYKIWDIAVATVGHTQPAQRLCLRKDTVVACSMELAAEAITALLAFRDKYFQDPSLAAEPLE